MASDGGATPRAIKPLTFSDLPPETQRDIVSHCSQSDLICLSLVSHHFRDLAAAQLYRNFHIVFPDEDDPSFDSPIDGLAGGLDTFVTSDYDYAQYLKDMSLDTLSAGSKAEAAYKPYLYNVSCGKFMNTLLLLTLRKAKALESFKWNIRVELSRQVYQALHQIDTLKHLHLRLQAGLSIYETPPPLPYNGATSLSLPISGSYAGQSITFAAAVMPPLPPSGPGAFYPPLHVTLPPSAPKPVFRSRNARKPPATKKPPTLSGFHKLKTLSVLDIDSLEPVPEIASCVQKSLGTLTKLKLSLSDSFGSQARKPAPKVDPVDESDLDDEFQVPPIMSPPSGYHDDASNHASTFRAQEEKKKQESILSKIFDVEAPVAKKAQARPKETEKAVEPEPTADPGRDFIESLKAVSRKLVQILQGTGDSSSSLQEHQETLDIITAAATKYVNSEQKKEEEKKQDDAGESSAHAASLGPSPNGSLVEGPTTVQSTLFEPTSKNKDPVIDVAPEDINIEEPEEQLTMEPQEAPLIKDISDRGVSATPESEPLANNSATPPGPSAPAASTGERQQESASASLSQLQDLVRIAAGFGDHMRTLDTTMSQSGKLSEEQALEKTTRALAEFFVKTQNAKVRFQAVEAKIQEAKSAQDSNKLVNEYLKATRGMALDTLSIYLIPVKASVLSRAIDLHVLKNLTLLNVGSQAPIWALLQKENKELPLQLRSIYTDNVSLQFLTFVSELETIEELYMLERDSKFKPESFAPKTTMTISQIRHLVLRRHLGNLKRLMIKNMADRSWDADDKTIMLLCKRGVQLQELAFSMGIRAIHTFMQQLSGLVELRALHIIHLRNDDTCMWVLRETKKFLVDNLSHYPEMKLEWLSLDDDDRVERLIRPSDLPRKEPKKGKKSDGKQPAGASASGGSTSLGNDTFPILPSIDPWDGLSDSDEDEDLQEHKLETMGDVHFYDVWGVRIFKKEIITGRL